MKVAYTEAMIMDVAVPSSLKRPSADLQFDHSNGSLCLNAVPFDEISQAASLLSHDESLVTLCSMHDLRSTIER